MSARFSSSDLARLGPDAQRQIGNVRLAERIRDEVMAEKRGNKFGAKRVQIDGIWFDSKAEGDRYAALKMEGRAGLIAGLRLQVPYEITVNGVRIGKWIADFEYRRAGETVTEDVKGVRTPVYRLKKRLVEALYGIRITEIQA